MAGSTRNISTFRGRLFIVITLAVVLVTVVGAVLIQRHLTRLSEEEFLALTEQRARGSIQSRKVRQAVLAEICADLARQPRIHAALEDDALDLLYPSATNELWQLMNEFPVDLENQAVTTVRALFYRFLDVNGQVIEPGEKYAHGWLPDYAEREISLDSLSTRQEVAYIRMVDQNGFQAVVEVITVPIISMETIQPIAALVVGFPFHLDEELSSESDLVFGVWINSQAYVTGFEQEAINGMEDKISPMLSSSETAGIFEVLLNGTKHQVILQPLNPESSYPPAYGMYLSSLAPLAQRQAEVNQEIILIAGIILVIGLVSAHFSANRLSRPVKALAEASEEEHHQRVSAELALDNASRELERAARFSADASHQLKTPVAVMRAGLEELMMTESLPPELHDEVYALINQTGRLTRVIEDLLLLSRLDAGCLEVKLEPIVLRNIIDGLVDDMSILPEGEQLEVEVAIDDSLRVLGNRTYTSLVFQSLLENARKYNCPKGRIRIQSKMEGSFVQCRIGNTGKGIHPAIQSQIFERFHRGDAGENVAGYGLGLNLAMELTRLHGGRLELLSSRDNWTEFQVSLQSVPADAFRKS